VSRAADAAPLLLRGLDEHQAERLIQAAADVALLLDEHGRVLELRLRDAALAKLTRGWRGKLWVDTVTVESRPKVEALLAGALEGDATDVRQVNHPLAGLPDLPLLYSTLRVAGGARSRTPLRVLALGRDLRDTVTIQRRLVEAQQTMERDYWRFREAEARYRNLFQASSEAVLIVDGSSLRVVEANPAALALAGRGQGKGAAKPVGQPLAALFGADGAEDLSAAIAAARSVGRHEPLEAALAGSGLRVTASISAFRQERSSFLLVRLAPVVAAPATPRSRAKAPAAADPGTLDSAFVRSATDALVFTDSAGRVVAVNRAFVRLAELSSEDQARGEPLDRWLGRTGVEMPVLLANLREGGSAGLFTTDLRGALGHVTEVEIAASTLDGAGPAAFAFAVRDIDRRAPAAVRAASRVPASAKQLTELVGRVPLRQIVAESSDLIERLSIETALTVTRDNRALAAQLLGLSRQSLYVKLRRFGIGGLGEDEEDTTAAN
jgi:transcriptional regulator PpsR